MVPQFPAASPARCVSSGCHNCPGTASGPPDAAEIGALRQARLDELFRREAPYLQSYFRRRMRPGEEALDFVQEAFVRLAQAAERAFPARPAAFLQRVARNILIDRTRRLKPQGEADPAELAVRAEQEDHLLMEDAMAIYQATLDRLPERTKVIFLFHRVDDLPYREIAERLGISISAVHKHIARALEELTIALRGDE